MPKSKTFKVKYFFDGFGEVDIKAKNAKEARDKFISGDDWQGEEKEWGENYVPETIKETK